MKHIKLHTVALFGSFMKFSDEGASVFCYPYTEKQHEQAFSQWFVTEQPRCKGSPGAKVLPVAASPWLGRSTL